MSARERAARAVELLSDTDPFRVEQGIELVRAQGVGFEQLVLSDLLRGGLRRVAPALLLCAPNARAAHPEALGYARWSMHQMIDATQMEAADRAVAREHVDALAGLGGTIEQIQAAVADTRVGVAAFLTRSNVGPRGASAYRRLAALHETHPDDYAAWAPALTRVVDAAFWSEIDASHGRAVRELERRCIMLLEAS